MGLATFAITLIVLSLVDFEYIVRMITKKLYDLYPTFLFLLSLDKLCQP